MQNRFKNIALLLMPTLVLAAVAAEHGAVAAELDNPKPVTVVGPVDVSGTVEVGNLPDVTGNVSVDNFPASQRVVIEGVEGPPVPIVGGVFLIPDPAGRPNTVRVEAVEDEVPVYVVGGTVTVENLEDVVPERVRGGQDVIRIESGTGLETFNIPADVTLTDLIVYNAGEYRSCLVDICDQRSDGCHLFFSFEPEQGLNSINLNTGIDGPAYIRVGRQIGACGMSLLWSGYSGTP